MSPPADTVCLVDCEDVDIHILDGIDELLVSEPLRCDVQGRNPSTRNLRKGNCDLFVGKGRIDEDGYVSIVGREKDMVITGGLNVYRNEIELFIDDLPGVSESAVIGVPHADFGEGVVAVVVPENVADVNEHDIIDACKARLANFKVPKRVVFVDELPRNTMAKVQKNLLRKSYSDLLN